MCVCVLQTAHRRSMKRIVSIFIMIAVAFGTGVFANSQDAMPERLWGLGIIQGDEGGIRPEDSLTRAEFCQMVARMLWVADINTEAMETGYADVPANHWASSCIIVLQGMGVVDGNGDGTFAPDENVLFDEAVKILVSAAEYQVEAEEFGGYPQGCRAVGARLGITRGVEAGEAPITRLTAANLINNTLDVVPLSKKYGTDEYEKNSDNLTMYELLLQRMDSVEIEGVVTANAAADLRDADADLEDGYVTVKVLKQAGENVEPQFVRFRSQNSYSAYMGYYVKGFAKYLKDVGIYEIFNLSPVERNNNLTVVQADDARLEAEYLEYWQDEQKKAQKVSIADDAVYIYNNRPLVSAEAEGMQIHYGQYRLLDNTGDKRADLVFIEEIESFVAEKVNQNNQTVYFADKQLYRGRNSFAYEPDDGEKVYELLDQEGKSVGFEEIKAGQGVTLMTSRDGSYTRVQISEKMVTGKVDGAKPEENEITIDGETYALSLNAEGVNPADIKIGDEGSFVLDVYGRVVGFFGVKVADLQYGYVVGAADNGAFGSELQLRVISGTKPVRQEKIENGNTKISYFFQNDQMKEYICSAKVKCYETFESIDAEGRYVQNFQSIAPTPELLRNKVIGFSFNSEGEINKLYLYALKTNDSELGNSEFNAKIISFGGEGTGNAAGRGYATNESTAFICVPNSASPNTDDYYVQLELKDESTGNYVYGVKTFFVPTSNDLSADEMREIQYAQPVDVLVIRADMNAADPAPVAQDADVCIVGEVAVSIGETGDDAGAEIYTLRLLNKDKEITENTPSSGKAFDTAAGLMKGDLIQYTRDGFGRIARIEQVGHIQGLDSGLAADDTRDHDYREEGNMLYGLAKNVERDLYYYNYNEMVNMITLDLGNGVERFLRVPTQDGPPVYRYERKTGWIYPSAAEDIIDGKSSICAFMDNDNMVSAVVIING